MSPPTRTWRDLRTRWTLAIDRQDLDGVWTVLSTGRPASGVSVAPIGYHVAAGQLLAGIDHEGRRHLLIPLLPGEAARTNTKGRAVHVARLAHGGANYMTVFCLLPELHHVFTQFCRELADSVEEATSPAREAAEAFDRWRDLFSDAGRIGHLSDEVLVGLLGELLAVEDLLNRGASSDLGFWVGPFNEMHDLRTPTHAIEVKATLVREGRVVSISSVDQLQEPKGADLVLRHLRLQRDPGGFDIEALVAAAIDVGADAGEVARRLHEFGLTIDALDDYRGRKYRVAENRLYAVNGTAFPRITRSSFVAGDLPPGTLRVAYSIDLTNEPPYPLSDAEADAVLDAFASEAAHGMDS